ncbi:hypothetical protein F4802DRAFT_345499 [Xylaria palmicola]|nr:hypothetical protein F4802DRAFT_345499 [Xylaria palmicola]
MADSTGHPNSSREPQSHHWIPCKVKTTTSLRYEAQNLHTRRETISEPTAQQQRQVQATIQHSVAEDQIAYHDLTDLRHVPQDHVLDQVAAADQLLVRTETGLQGNKGAREKTNEPQIRWKIQESLLKWLSFPSMHRRLDEIPQSYGDTFEWMFDPELKNEDFSNFCKWLGQPDSGLYWVKGREGSGKSTLMKFIWQSLKTREYLKPWQGTSELSTAAFSLWKVGSSLAKSQAGLLRSLLHTLLSQKPDLISLALSHYWSLLYREMDDAAKEPRRLNPPLVSDLVIALKRLINARGGSLKIFLLVDGLDEYEGDINAIVQLCKDIASSSNVKIVFSSRETGYDIFIRAFAGSPRLQLERMNRKDIEKFVKGCLDSAETSSISEDDRDKLARGVAERSRGLFIWASLVVPSLLEGLVEGNPLRLLRQRLNMRPIGLRRLYDEIFRKIPTEQKQYVSKMLQILLEWSRVQTFYTSEVECLNSIPLLDLCLADGRMAEVLGGPPASKEEIAARCKNLEMRLKTQCADFIVVHRVRSGGADVDQAQPRVEYSHRTVLDHFKRRAGWLRQFTKATELNPSLSLLKSVVQRLQILDVPESRQAIWNLAVAALVYANHVESVLAGQRLIPAEEEDSIEEVDFPGEEPDDLNELKSDDGPGGPEGSRAEATREIEKAKEDASDYVRLLTGLDKTMQKHHEKLLKVSDAWMTKTYILGSRTKNDKGWQSRHLARLHWSNFHPTFSQPLIWKSDFLSLAVQFGLLRYLSHRLGQDGKLVRAKKGRPLLEYALCPLDSVNHDLITVEMVQKLLEHGARPEHRFLGRSSWESALAWENTYFEALSGNMTPREAERYSETRLKVFLLLLQRGADPRVRCCVEGRDVSFDEFLDKVFRKNEGADLEAVRLIALRANERGERRWKRLWAL